MGIFEIISAIILIIACVFIVIVVLMQDTKTQMSQSISGGSGDNYFGKNSGRTREAMLHKATTAAAIVFFVLAILVNVFNIYFKDLGTDKDTSSSSSFAETDFNDGVGDEEDLPDDGEDETPADGGDETPADGGDESPADGGDTAPEGTDSTVSE